MHCKENTFSNEVVCIRNVKHLHYAINITRNKYILPM